MKMWFCQKSNFLFSLKLLSNVKVACRSVGEMEERVRGKCAAFKIRRGCIFTGIENKNYTFSPFSDALSYDQLGTKLEKCLWEPDGWIDQSLADFTSTLRIENRIGAVPSAGYTFYISYIRSIHLCLVFTFCVNIWQLLSRWISRSRHFYPLFTFNFYNGSKVESTFLFWIPPLQRFAKQSSRSMFSLETHFEFTHFYWCYAKKWIIK